MRKKILALAISSAFCMEQAVAAQPTLEEKLEILQQEIESLKVQMKNNQAAQGKSSTLTLASDMPGYDASATGGKRFDYGQTPTVIGGYGEAIYNNYRDGSVKDQADLRRFLDISSSGAKNEVPSAALAALIWWHFAHWNLSNTSFPSRNFSGVVGGISAPL